MPQRPRAAVMLVGDELLSAKIRDENGWFLAQRLRERGVRLEEICTVPDDPQRIADTLLRLLELAPIVFTSGGVGPTHDDLTLEAIALATERPLERHAQLESILRRFYKSELNAAALRMADVPRGTRLVAEQGWPVLRLDLERKAGPARVYILPGVPSLLRAKVEALEGIEGELPSGPGWSLVDTWLGIDESDFADALTEVARDHPEVAIGSYPRWLRDAQGAHRIRVRLTFEADAPETAAAARDALLAKIDPAAVVDAPEA